MFPGLKLIHLFIAWCFMFQFIRFLRRTEGVEAARKYFLDARKSPNFTYHVYVAYALMAFCQDKDPKVFSFFIYFCKTLYTMEHQQYSTVLIGIRIVYLQSYLWDQIEKANFLIAAIFVLYGWLIWLIRLSKNHINMIFVVSFFLSLSISQLADDPFLPQTSGHPDFPLGRSTTKLTCCLL